MLESLITVMFSVVVVSLVIGFIFLIKDLIQKEKEYKNKTKK